MSYHILGNPFGGLFQYYLPGGYKFNRVIAIIETGCNTGYFGKCRVAACFGITCQAVIIIFDRVIAITETGCDTGYFGKFRAAACFSITCLAVINSTVL